MGRRQRKLLSREGVPMRGDRDLSGGGPDLAAQAIKAGLVDEVHLFLNPVVVGGGKPSLPDDIRLDLELLDESRFGNGVVHVHYRSLAASAR